MIKCGLILILQDHYHFYDSEKDELIDIDKNEISFSKSSSKSLQEKSKIHQYYNKS